MLNLSRRHGPFSSDAEKPRCRVVIVGAGPAGLLAAINCGARRAPYRAARGTPRPMAVAPAALHQMPRCTANSRASIVPGQFFFSPEVDAELPVVPGASTCDAAPATVAHIDQLRAASPSMVVFYHNKDRQTPEEQTAAAGAS